MILGYCIHPMATKTKAAPALEEFTVNTAPEDGLEDSSNGGDWQEEGIEPACEFNSEASETEEAELPARLTGPELVAFYAEKKAAGRTHSEIAFAAGYYTITKSGQERTMMARFNEAYLEAQGIETGGREVGPGRSHAGETKARVSGQGILLVSQLATRKVGAKEGEVFEVSYPGDGAILLTPTGVVKPVQPRKAKVTDEQPGTPLLDDAQAA